MQKRTIASMVMAVGVAAAAMAVAPPQRAAAATANTISPGAYYLSLGDSLAQGVQPNSSGVSVETNQGYADDLYNIERLRFHHLQLAKLGCPGETTTTMIKGGICSYPQGSQLAAATAFLASHQVRFVTIDIGANNVDGCLVNGQVDIKCIAAGIATAQADLPVILQTLRTAGHGVPIFAMNYYDPFLAAYLQGSSGQALARASVLLTVSYNKILRALYSAFHVRVADVQHSFSTQNFAIVPGLGIPLNVALICSWTWMCAPPPVGPNIHANAIGYEVIAVTFAMRIGLLPY